MADYAVQHLIDWLGQQIEAAPLLTVADAIPGTGSSPEIWQATILDRIAETVNRSKNIHELKAIEGGQRRYGKHCMAALAVLEPVKTIFQEADMIRGARYDSGEARDKALARLQDRPKKVEQACKTAVAELKLALALLEQGDAKSEQRESVAQSSSRPEKR